MPPVALTVDWLVRFARAHGATGTDAELEAGAHAWLGLDRQPGRDTDIHKGEQNEEQTACGRSIFENPPTFLVASVRWPDVTCAACLRKHPSALEREHFMNTGTLPGGPEKRDTHPDAVARRRANESAQWTCAGCGAVLHGNTQEDAKRVGWCFGKTLCWCRDCSPENFDD